MKGICLFAISLLLTCNAGFAQQKNGSVFTEIPAIAKQIASVPDKETLLPLLKDFELRYPAENFKQAAFLLDQVYGAAVVKMLAWDDQEALPFILKVDQATARMKLMEALPAKGWKTPLVDSISHAYAMVLNQTGSADIAMQLRYAELLYFKGAQDEALRLLEATHEAGRLAKLHPKLMEKLYRSTFRYPDAIGLLSEQIASGKAAADAQDNLAELWLLANGSSTGFAAHYASLLQVVRREKEGALTEKAVDYPAADFELLDMDGQVVSLHSLRGKVVFLDFWATWCAPCIASFPTMQRVVDLYKDRSDVVFLFVNTLEKKMEPAVRKQRIKEVLAQRDLRLRVILDSQEDGEYTLPKKYKIGSIPSQFVIDKNGQVRYALNGFDGSADGLIQEIDLLIQQTLRY